MRLFRRFARLADRWENRTFGRYAARRRRYEARHFEPDAFRVFLFNLLDRLAPIQAALVKNAVHTLERLNFGRAEARAT